MKNNFITTKSKKYLTIVFEVVIINCFQCRRSNNLSATMKINAITLMSLILYLMDTTLLRSNSLVSFATLQNFRIKFSSELCDTNPKEKIYTVFNGY